MVTSYMKSRYIVPKSQLGIFINDLFSVVTSIDFLLQNYYQEYIIVFEKTKNNILMILKIANTSVYQDLTSYITSFALFRIYKQYLCLVNKSQSLLSLTKNFTKTTYGVTMYI